jgi:prolyl oligopeptidase PreP (S9A serine peptidase family)
MANASARVILIFLYVLHRVHPAHARKMVFKMLNGQESRNGLYYYENIEGGHGGAADSDQVKPRPKTLNPKP